MSFKGVGNDGREWTHEDIAQELGVTRQRVVQIESKAIAKCRAILEAKGLTLNDLLTDAVKRRR